MRHTSPLGRGVRASRALRHLALKVIPSEGRFASPSMAARSSGNAVGMCLTNDGGPWHHLDSATGCSSLLIFELGPAARLGNVISTWGWLPYGTASPTVLLRVPGPQPFFARGPACLGCLTPSRPGFGEQPRRTASYYSSYIPNLHFQPKGHKYPPQIYQTVL